MNVDKSKCEWVALTNINDALIPMKIDTGAQVNILSKDDVKGLKQRPKMLKSVPKLIDYNDCPIKTVGACRALVTVGRRQMNIKFAIVEEGQSLFGAHDSERLGLVKRSPEVNKIFAVKSVSNTEEVIENYKEIFKGLGCLEGKSHIYLKENAVPVIYPARKVPVALKAKLKEELDRMEKMGVLKKAEGPSEWVLPLVIVEKPSGQLRVCMDPMDLNKFIRREHSHLPHKSEIWAEMAGTLHANI